MSCNRNNFELIITGENQTWQVSMGNLRGLQSIVTCQTHPVLVKKGESNVWFVPFKIWRLPCRSGPPVDGPKDPWPRVLSLPERFVGEPASLARDTINR